MAPLHPFFDGLVPPLHIAHRGGALLAPENTLPAFEQAVARYGTDMLELDVQLTRDGMVVVAHDDTVDRCTDGRGDIRELTLAEVQRLDAGHAFSPDGGRTFPFRGAGVRIPTLREVLAAFPAVRFNVEVKRALPNVEDLVAEELRRAHSVPRVCLGATDDALAARLVDAVPEACHFYPREALTAFVLHVRSGDEPPEDPRYSLLDMPAEYQGMQLIDPALVSAARRHGKWINVWTIDDPAQMRALAALGVGGIMTDRPDLLREQLGSR
jgi:glycerophosphoryl diester phosphodiesterase